MNILHILDGLYYAGIEKQAFEIINHFPQKDNKNFLFNISPEIKDLSDDGHQIFAVSIGPISSNWDRAVEVFYQIKGGQVDYGSSHSGKNKIIRMPKGKSYVGLYPQWSNENPVHLIGHSMGGQTARMLHYLLTQEINQNNNKKLT